ncbi:acyl carrier protein [Nordella sp. HKS 07]|uniref:acyl carrier protein n=1 Tax=Nordella sp. HKS 07 TaxID=2712222 RepID=UPI0013E0EA9B|nr:acyl carrier protein [Nordella sp. HKS 07]QIG50921.1 acyl carrier protein [Nordella sp. HKS 07]
MMTADEARGMVLSVLQNLELIDEKQMRELLGTRILDIELAGLGIDSMKVVDLCVGLEERIGREVEVEELIENPSVNSLAAHFAKG